MLYLKRPGSNKIVYLKIKQELKVLIEMLDIETRPQFHNLKIL